MNGIVNQRVFTVSRWASLASC